MPTNDESDLALLTEFQEILIARLKATSNATNAVESASVQALFAMLGLATFRLALLDGGTRFDDRVHTQILETVKRWRELVKAQSC